MASRRHATSGDHHFEHTIRQQEVLRATKELAAYFKGQRTEREARAALKTIKAFVRYRERLAPGDRPPLAVTSRSARKTETKAE